MEDVVARDAAADHAGVAPLGDERDPVPGADFDRLSGLGRVSRPHDRSGTAGRS